MIVCLWSWTRNLLAIVGAASLVSLAVFWVNLSLMPENVRRMSLPAVSPVAEDLARKIAPGLQRLAADYEPTFAAAAPGPLSRWAVGKVYPRIVEEVPRGTELGCDRLLSHFGTLTVADLVGLVVRHAQSKGEPVNASLQLHAPAPVRFP